MKDLAPSKLLLAFVFVSLAAVVLFDVHMENRQVARLNHRVYAAPIPTPSPSATSTATPTTIVSPTQAPSPTLTPPEPATPTPTPTPVIIVMLAVPTPAPTPSPSPSPPPNPDGLVWMQLNPAQIGASPPPWVDVQTTDDKIPIGASPETTVIYTTVEPIVRRLGDRWKISFEK